MSLDLEDVPAGYRDAVAATLRRAGIDEGHLAVELVDAARIHELNLAWRGIDRPTDVLSFPVDEPGPADEETPLDPKYNQVHLPGSNARGTNFIATKEFVYLIEGNRCNLIDIRTGEIARVFETGDDSTKELGYIGVYDNLLILGNNFAQFPGLENDSIRIKNPKYTDYNLSASRELMVMDRFSGKILWRMKANHGFLHNAVIAGDSILFCLDKLPQYLETKLRRRGEDPPDGSRLLYIRAATGEILYETTTDVFGTWLGYSEQHKLLLQATRPSRDMLNGEEGRRMIAFDTGTREKIWDREFRYANPRLPEVSRRS